MDAAELTLMRKLLTERRVATLAVLLDGEPYTGLLPFVVAEDFSAAFIHASDLAQHSAGLQPGAPYSLLIHADDAPDADPLQIPRLSLQGHVERLEHDTPAYTQAAGRYQKRFPNSAVTFSFRDFHLYRLPFERGRFVAGFARAYNVSPALLRQLAEQPADFHK